MARLVLPTSTSTRARVTTRGPHYRRVHAVRERPGAPLRLHTLEFAGMLGVLGGLVLVGTLPEGWRWNLTLLVACGPLLAAIAGVLALRRHLAAAGDAPETPAGGAPAASAPGRREPLAPVVRLM